MKTQEANSPNEYTISGMEWRVFLSTLLLMFVTNGFLTAANRDSNADILMIDDNDMYHVSHLFFLDGKNYNSIPFNKDDSVDITNLYSNGFATITDFKDPDDQSMAIGLLPQNRGQSFEWEGVDGQSGAMAYSPDGSMMIYQFREETKTSYWIYSFKDQQRRQFIKEEKGQIDFHFSPDNKKISYLGDSEDGQPGYVLYVMDLETQQTKSTPLPTYLWDFTQRWSPDSSKISFLIASPDENSDMYNKFELWLFNANTVKFEKILMTTGDMVEEYAWSPDSSSVYYLERTGSRQNKETGQAVIQVNMFGEKKEIAPPTSWKRSMVVSPDGKKVAFCSSPTDADFKNGKYAGVDVVDTNSGEIKQVWVSGSIDSIEWTTAQ